ncbi:T9SS type A sorting domain-containing protein, partial [Winogradskyella maritima]
GNVYTPGSGDIAAGTVDLTYTTNDPDGPCDAKSDDLTVTINPLPDLTAIPDQMFCPFNDPMVDLTALEVENETGGQWSYFDSVANEYVDIDDATSVNPNLGFFAPFRYTFINEFNCSDTIEVTFEPNLSNTGLSVLPIEYCADDASGDLSSFVNPGTYIDDNGIEQLASVLWYTTGDNPDEVGSPNAPDAPTSSTTFFVVQVIGNGCFDLSIDARIPVVVEVNPNPACSISGPTDVCVDLEQTYNYTGGSENIDLLWKVTGSGQIIGSTIGDSVTVLPNGVGNYEVSLTVTYQDTACSKTCSYNVVIYDCCDSETAFAYNANSGQDTSNICFLDNQYNNFDRWGWAIEGLDFETDISDEAGAQYNSYVYNLYAGNGNDCDPTDGPGTLVGNVTVTREGNSIVAYYDVSESPDDEYYSLYGLHLNVACDGQPFPKKKRRGKTEYTVAPGQYTSSSNAGGSDMGSVTVNNIGHKKSSISGCLSNISIIVHAEVDVCTFVPFASPTAKITDSFNKPDVMNDKLNVEPTGDFIMHPVPYNNELNIEYGFSYDTDINIVMYDIKGTVVLNRTIKDYKSNTNANIKIDMSRMISQMYFVKLSTNKDVITKRAISNGY